MIKVELIVTDSTAAGMYLALIKAGIYLPFEKPVPFGDEAGLLERGLLNESGAISGRAVLGNMFAA
jgi:putative restriction endonuclease